MASYDVDGRFVLNTAIEHTGREIMNEEYGRVTEVRFYGAACAAFAIYDVTKQLEGGLEEQLKCESSDLCHPNVLKFLGLCHSDSTPLLVTEMVHETVTSLVESQPHVPLPVKLSILLDVSNGLWYLHSRKPAILHGSLSCNSIFLTDQLVAKITTLKLHGKADGSTPQSKLQEALQETGHNTSVPIDVFSYGAVILHVVNQELPKPLYYSEAHCTPKMISELKHQGHLSSFAGLEVALLPLVENCLSDDPTTRPTMENVHTNMEAICEPFTGIDNTLWRLGVEDDPTITASKKRISEVVEMASEIHRANQRVVEQDQVITSLRKQLALEKKPAILNPSGEAIHITWEEGNPLPAPLSSGTAVVHNAKIYYGGYLDINLASSFNIFVYDIDGQKWDPSPIKTLQALYGMTVLNDTLLLAGGVTDQRMLQPISTTNEVCVLLDGKWKQFSTMPHARALLIAVGYHSMLIVIGGQDTQCVVKSNVEVLDTTTNQWHTCNSLPDPHYQLCCAIVNDTLYLTGGSNSRHQSSLEVFSASLTNLEKDQQLDWQCLPNTPHANSVPVGLYKDHLLVVGGKQTRTDGKLYRCSDVYVLNTATRSWEVLDVIPAPRSTPGIVSLDDHTIVVMGGTVNDVPKNTVWIGVSLQL